MAKECDYCKSRPAKVLRQKNLRPVCLECFYELFENEVHITILEGKMFERGERVAIGASGGKDSTVLIHVLKLLNEKYDYGLDLILLSIDEGIKGYRDDSLETVKKNREMYGLPLSIVPYKQLYDWTMDEVVGQIGLKNNCTYCGVFRRQALEKGAKLLDCNKIATGHNADDIAETVIMNLLRGDSFRLSSCVEPVTGKDSDIPRVKPFKYAYQKEIVMYAWHKKLDFFSTECIYSPNAFRGNARDLIKQLELVRPSTIIDIIHAAECLDVEGETKIPTKMECERCGSISSNKLCKACILIESLNKEKKKKTVKVEFEQEEAHPAGLKGEAEN